MRARNETSCSVFLRHLIDGPDDIQIARAIGEKRSIGMNGLMRTGIARYGIVEIHRLPTHIAPNLYLGGFQREWIGGQFRQRITLANEVAQSPNTRLT